MSAYPSLPDRPSLAGQAPHPQNKGFAKVAKEIAKPCHEDHDPASTAVGARKAPRTKGPSRTRACNHKSRLASSGWSMSALPPKADMLSVGIDVCQVPDGDIK